LIICYETNPIKINLLEEVEIPKISASMKLLNKVTPVKTIRSSRSYLPLPTKRAKTSTTTRTFMLMMLLSYRKSTGNILKVKMTDIIEFKVILM
jgi:hypothetical protein